MENVEQVRTYAAILYDSLLKKDGILLELLSLTKEQHDILLDEGEMDMDDFNDVMDDKEVKIQELLAADQGFEFIFEKVKEPFTNNKNLYENEIKKLQEMIAKVTDKSIKLQALEQDNKHKLEIFFSQKRSQIKNFKMSNKTVASYYKSMSGRTDNTTYFMDTKK